MNIKQILSTILLIIWMFIIFHFSNQPAVQSQSVSDNFMKKIIEVYTQVTQKNISISQRNKIVKKNSFFLRKCAHFLEYFILGILIYFNLIAYNCNRKFILSIIFCFLYACTDEFHQIFLIGRTAKLFDIFIDTLGGTIGSCLIFFLKK